ncbi:hypothetical protein BT63DRAFT_129093 [Microthyrium microscopicum]|uniref:HD domain-containing protein n=1 Tax=Microthyrium microscopicum TaxID=703497 RepID=A0A6A6TV47_9PEZI|nr:hypothetical protein BT63DRAFT_129093 [Microthyrium microscopicum]
MFHDIGATAEHNEDQRFEVEGADAAVYFMQKYDSIKSDMEYVWQAISLHTSPGIAERISPIALCLRLAVKLDFGHPHKHADETEQVELCSSIEETTPRLSIEKVLGDAIVAQAVTNPVKAPKVSWPWCLLVAYQENPHHEGVNPGF